MKTKEEITFFKMTDQDKNKIYESLRQDWLEQKRKDNA